VLSFALNSNGISVLLFGPPVLLRLVTTLPWIIVLFVITLLVKAAATYRKFALSHIPPGSAHGIVAAGTVD